MLADRHRYISTGNLLETSIVIGSLHNPVLNTMLERFVTGFNVILVPFTMSQLDIARQAYRQYGRGSGHPAKLNFGDCFSYALAIDFDEPLLFKGNDFNHTNVRIAQSPETT
jgi:ribonuclease VapC